METVITDKAGRRLTLRKVGVLETLRLFKALGPDLANNQPYMSTANIAAQVFMVDDVPVPFPTNEADLEALLKRVGDDGMAELMALGAGQSPTRTVTDAGN